MLQGKTKRAVTGILDDLDKEGLSTWDSPDMDSIRAILNGPSCALVQLDGMWEQDKERELLSAASIRKLSRAYALLCDVSADFHQKLERLNIRID
tara:strand:+ start:983 stop:1267 length:285 start_codon:yes stop_codon:yes gene_type:complete